MLSCSNRVVCVATPNHVSLWFTRKTSGNNKIYFDILPNSSFHLRSLWSFCNVTQALQRHALTKYCLFMLEQSSLCEWLVFSLFTEFYASMLNVWFLAEILCVRERVNVARKFIELGRPWILRTSTPFASINFIDLKSFRFMISSSQHQREREWERKSKNKSHFNIVMK